TLRRKSTCSGLLRPVGAEQQCLSSCGQHLWGKRLAEVSAGALLRRRLPAGVIAAGRQHNNGKALVLRLTSDESQDVDAVHVWHIEVEHDQLNGRNGQLFDRFESRCGFDELQRIERLERGAYHLSDRRGVVNDKDALHRINTPGRCSRSVSDAHKQRLTKIVIVSKARSASSSLKRRVGAALAEAVFIFYSN